MFEMTNNPPGLIDTQSAARILGVSPQTLVVWRCRGGGPRFVKVGRCARYAMDDLNAFIAAGRRGRTSTSDNGAAATR